MPSWCHSGLFEVHRFTCTVQDVVGHGIHTRSSLFPPPSPSPPWWHALCESRARGCAHCVCQCNMIVAPVTHFKTFQAVDVLENGRSCHSNAFRGCHSGVLKYIYIYVCVCWCEVTTGVASFLTCYFFVVSWRAQSIMSK